MSSSSDHDDSTSKEETKKTKKRSKTPKKEARRSWKYMITEAIWEEKKWNKGSSRSYIKNYILDNYDVESKQLKDKLTTALADMLEPEEGAPSLIEVDNNYKLTSDWRTRWRKRYGIKSDKRKKKKDKNAPKGPRNAYNYFIKTNHSRRAEENPEKESMQITKLLADEWKKLSAAKRQKYDEMAEEDRGRHDREMKEYKKKKKEKICFGFGFRIRIRIGVTEKKEK